MNLSNDEKPKVSIGLPVYNGGKFIRKRLETLLSQTFTDFELIISDNASTDSTSEICKKFEKKDKRIRYIRQESNMGAVWNFNFVLKEARCDYFVWASADDLWHTDFLKKNMGILVTKKNFVGCKAKETLVQSEDVVKKNYSSARKYLRDKMGLRRTRQAEITHLFPITGSYDNKVRKFMKLLPGNMFYGVIRTDALRKSTIDDSFMGADWCYDLNILRYGDFYELEETMLYRIEHGESWGGVLSYLRVSKHGFLGTIFPCYPFTLWFAKNLGVKLFLRNFDHILLRNIEAELALIFELTLLIKNKVITKL